MGQVRHGSATTTHAVRAAIQRSQASLATLSRELGINPKTVAKWRKRQTVEDLKTGPQEPRSTVLTEAEEAETINGLFKAEVIHRRGPWRSFEAVEYATLEWVDRFNNRRLLEPIGNIPPCRSRSKLLRSSGN